MTKFHTFTNSMLTPYPLFSRYTNNPWNFNFLIPQVTGGNGEAYAQSFLKATLGAGQSYTIPAFGGGDDVVIEVDSINSTSTPWVATVTVKNKVCESNLECDDGNACNGDETCNTGTGLCEAGTPVSGECCGNDVCEAGEDETCSDCAKVLSTTWVDNNGSSGNVFKVVANSSVNINAFKIHATNAQTCQTIVWARAGDYAGTENSSVGWNQIQDVSKFDILL